MKPLLQTILFTILFPGAVTGLVPYLIESNYTALGLDLGVGRFAGLPVAIAGVLIYLATAGAFALIGRGTPMPLLPTETLVVEGLHRYVRNPMYIGVLSVILGEALWLESGLLLLYMAFVFTAFNTFIRVYEEPTLRRSYGEEYERYCESTPRWRPRISVRKAEAKED